MTRQILGFASAALFALGVSTVSAQPQSPQDPTGGKVGGGSSAGGESAPAAPSPSSSSGASGSSSGGTATPMSSGGGSGMSSGSSWGEGRTIEGPRMAAPRRSSPASYSEDGGGQRERAMPRGGGSSGERATPRGGGSSDRGDNGGSRERAVPRGEAGGGRVSGRSGSAAPPADDQPGRSRAVPTYSRPREGRAVVGTPIERSEASRIRGGSGAWYYDPYWSGGYGYSGYYGYGYRPYRAFGYPGYGFGLGYFYDPFMFGSFWSDPYYGGYAGYGGYYGGGGAGYYQGRGYDTGSLRLKIRPSDAKVYIDGYFVGVVDSFDGVFQKLAVEGGTHRVEIRADGYEPVQFEVLITPGETVTYKGDLKRIIP